MPKSTIAGMDDDEISYVSTTSTMSDGKKTLKQRIKNIPQVIKDTVTSILVALRDTTIWSRLFLAVTVFEIVVVLAAGITHLITNFLKERYSYSAIFLTLLSVFTALAILYF